MTTCTRCPSPGTWSIQQIIIHLLDSDLVLADRMKRVIAEEKPSLLAFDENRWAKQLAYDFRSADDAVAMFGLNRKQMAEVMRRLPDEAFARTGTHNSAASRRSSRSSASRWSTSTTT